MARIVLLFPALALLLAAPAAAHHSYGEYDRQHPVSIEGIVQQVMIANPHPIMRIKTSDGVVYTAEWSTVMQLARSGVQTGTLRPGDRVIVTGSPLRDRSFHTLSLLTEVRRPSDGWKWSRPSPQN
jgi:hypothetical protein